MRGYPKGPLTKQDYENLLSTPEHADRAKADLIALAAIDDSKITVDQGTEIASKLVQISNPMPRWKRAGFRSKIALTSASAAVDLKPIETIAEER